MVEAMSVCNSQKKLDRNEIKIGTRSTGARVYVQNTWGSTEGLKAL